MYRTLTSSLDMLGLSELTSESSLLDYLDSVTVGISHEADAAAALAHGVGRLLGHDALLSERRERVVEGVRRNGDVAIARTQVVGLGAGVERQFQAIPVARHPHEDVGRAVRQ